MLVRPGQIAKRCVPVVAFTLAVVVGFGQSAAQATEATWRYSATLTAGDIATPGQLAGSAAGRGHAASAADTKAADGVQGHAPGVAPHQLQAAAAHQREAAPRLSSNTAAVTAASTSTPPGKTESSFDAARSSLRANAGDEHTLVYDNPDHTSTAKISAGRVQYFRPDHRWAPIDNTLTRAGNGRWTKRADSQDAQLAPNAADAALGSLAVDAGQRVSFGVAGAAPAVPQVSGDTATYQLVRPDSDVQLQTVESGIKETLVLRSPAAPTSWVFPLAVAGLTPSLAVSGDVVFTDQQGAVRVRIPHGSMVDSAVDPRSNEGAWSSGVTYHLITVNGGPALQVDLDAQWLHDPARKFPVVVDPTTLTSTASTYVINTDWTNHSASPLLNVGSYDRGVHAAGAALKFDNFAGTFANDFIRGAWLSVYDAFDQSCTPQEVKVWSILKQWYPDAVNSDSPLFGAVLGSKAFASSPKCSGGKTGSFNWATIGLDPSAFDSWAHGGGVYGLSLSADVHSAASWKQLASSTSANKPYLSVDFSPYGVKWPGNLSWSTTPTAATDGVLQVPVQNWGNAAWTSGNGYQLRYTQTNADTGAFLSQGTANVPGTVAPQQSVTIPITIAHQPAGTPLRVVLDMVAPDGSSFSSWFAPTEIFDYTPADIAPQIDRQSPPSNVTEGTLTPTFSATGHDPDNYRDPVTYGFWVCPATAKWPDGCTSSGWLPAGISAWTVPAGKLAYNQSYYWVAEAYDGIQASYPSAPSWFTTVVGQPVITSHLAQNSDQRGFDPEIGNYTTAATDLTVPGAGLKLGVERTYNSLDPRTPGAFGAGWWSVFDMQAVPDADGTGNVVVTYPNGQAVRFGRNADGTFTAPQGRYATLTPTGTTGYTLVDKLGTTYVFTGSAGAAAFPIASITDRAGHQELFAYAGGRLTTVTNTTSHRALHLTWTTPAGARAAHVSAVATDPVVTGNPASAATATYQYTADQLTSACRPGPECTGYTYQAGAHDRSVVLDAEPSAFWRLADQPGAEQAVSEVLQNEGEDTARRVNAAFGKLGPNPTATAAEFDGTQSFVQLPQDQIKGVAFLTVQLWFSTTASGTAQMLLATGNDPANAANPGGGAMPVLYIGTDNKLHGHFWDTTMAGMASAAPVNDGRWHQVTLTGSAGAQALYLDGKPIGTESGTIFNVDPYTIVGAGVFNSNGWPAAPGGNTWSHFHGSIADVAIYPKPLSAIQIASQYDGAANPAALLTGTTLPSGKTAASARYDTRADRLVELTDQNAGTWHVGGPTVSGTSEIYRSTVLGAAPYGYWRLGDSAGTTAAGETDTQTGTYTGATLGVEGPFGRNDSTAASFNGTSSYVQLPSDMKPYPVPNLYPVIPDRGPMAIELWFSTKTSGVLFSYSEQPITGTPSANVIDYTPALYVGTDNKLHGGTHAYDLRGNVLTMQSKATVTDGKWHHAVLSVDGSLQTLYLDGTSVGTLNFNGAYPSNYVYAGAGFIGNEWPAAPQQGTGTSGHPSYFTGSIAEVAIYQHELSSDDVVHHIKAYGNSLSHASPTLSVAVEDPAGNPQNYTYDPYNGGRLVSSSDVLNHTTSYGYDTGGFLHTVTDPNGVQVITGHDVRGNEVSRTTCQDFLISKCSTAYYTYFPDDTSTSLQPDPRNDVVTSFRDGRSADATDARYATRYTYDVNGNLLSTAGPAVDGAPAGRTTSTVYTDGTAAFPSIDGGAAPPALPAKTTTPGGATTSYRYLSNGDLASVTDAAGLVTSFTYDGLGRALTSKQTSDSYPAGLVTALSYDVAGRQTTVTAPGVTDRVTGTVHTAKTTTSYDRDGNIVQQVVADTTGGDAARTAKTGYDDSNRVVSTTDPAGAESKYTYDVLGHRTSLTDPAGTTTAYEYLADGHLATTTLRGYRAADGSTRDLVTQSFAYDPAGRLASTTDAMGRVTNYQYYDNGKLQSKSHPDPVTGKTGFKEATYEYDSAGNNITVCRNNCQYGPQALLQGLFTRYRFDAADRVTTATTQYDSAKIGTVPVPQPRNSVTKVTYDPDDHPVAISSTDEQSPSVNGTNIGYTYDPLGRKTSETVQQALPAQAADAALLAQWDLADGATTTAADGFAGVTAGPATPLPLDDTRYPAATSKVWNGQAARLAWQNDGNLVLYRNSDNVPVWSSGTGGKSANAVLVLQSDGNIVIYGDPTFKSVLWHTQSGGNPGSKASLTARGELVVTGPSGATLFTSRSAQLGFNNPATLSGGVSWRATDPYSDAFDNKGSVRFDGVTGQASTAGPVVDTTGSFTVSLWVRPDEYGARSQTFVAQQGAQQPGFALEYQGSTGNWAFTRALTDTPNAPVASAQGWVSGSSGGRDFWTHLVGVYDRPSGKMSLYVNGELRSTATDTTPFAATGAFLIGRGFANGQADAFTDGKMSNVRVYSRALSDSEVNDLARTSSSTGPGQRGLAGYWRLTDGSADAAAPSAGGVTATPSGEVSWSAEHGGAAQFDGASGAIQSKPLNGFNHMKSYTVAAWAKLDTTAKSQTVVSHDGGILSTFALRYDATAKKWALTAPASNTEGAALTSAVSATTPVAGVWTHLTGAYDADAHRLSLYVNGQLAGSVPYTASTAYEGKLVIGAGMSAKARSEWLDGRVSGVKVFQQVLTADQIGTLYAGGNLLHPTTTQTTTWTVDQRGLATSMTDARGNAPGASKAAYTTTYENDEAGRLASVLAPMVNTEVAGGSATPTRPRTVTGYDTFGDVTETQDPTGNITTTGYDPAGRPASVARQSYTAPGATAPVHAVTVTTYNQLGLPATVTDPLGNQTGFAYDQLGKPVKRTDPAGGEWTYAYNADGELTAATDPTGAQNQLTYDYLGRKLTSTQVVRQTGAAYTTTYGYNGQGDLATVTTPAGVLTKGTFDNAGEQLTVVDGAGNTTTNSYANGRLVATVAPDGSKVSRGYDAAGHLTKLSESDSTGAVLRTTSTGYDAVGNRTSATDATGVTTEFGYDAANRLVSQLEHVSATSNIVTTYGYDAAGNRTRYTDGNGNPWISTYNAWGLPESQVDPSTPTFPALADRTSTTGYDAAGRPAEITKPGGVRQTRTYDVVGNLKRETGSGAGVDTPDREFGYDTAGRLTSASAPGGTNTFTYDDRGLLTGTDGPSGKASFGYDADGRTTSRTDAAGTTAYTYDKAGRPATLTDPLAQVVGTYSYTKLNQLAGIDYGTGNNTRAFTYDALHRPKTDTWKTSTGTAAGSITYDYDLADRETGKTTTGFAGSSANAYTYDQAGRLSTWDNGTASTAYGYDAAGNRTTVGSRTLTYNARDQLVNDGTRTYGYTARGTRADLPSDAFDQELAGDSSYDALGRLVAHGTTKFAYSGLGATIASEGGTTYSHHADGGGHAAAKAGSALITLTDRHNDLVGSSTPGGTALAGSTTFDPLGKPTARAGTQFDLGYQSGFTDGTSGRVNMGARWYDPGNGQFGSRDTVSNSPNPSSANANPYAYANGNPVNGTDPTGHWCWGCIAGGAIGLVGGALIGCLATIELGCVGGAGVGAWQGAAWGAAAGIWGGLAAQVVSDISNPDWASGGTAGIPTVEVPVLPLPVITGIQAGAGGHATSTVRARPYVPRPPPPPTPTDYAKKPQPHPFDPILGSGSGIAASIAQLISVVTALALPADELTQYQPEDLGTLASGGLAAGGALGLTDSPDGPHLPKPPSPLDLFNIANSIIGLHDCHTITDCAAAALGIIPGEALAGAAGRSLADSSAAVANDGPERILFGQARISPEYSGKTSAPDYLRNRNIYDVASDLKNGRLSPDQFHVVAFRHLESGELVTNNNRSLAVLSLAGLRPTNLRILNTPEEIARAIQDGSVDRDLLDRLSEGNPLEDTLPSVRIPVTPSQTDLTIDYSDPQRPGVIYIPEEWP
jgi:RHS repeat-associated protein